jgi:hypothetical protein
MSPTSGFLVEIEKSLDRLFSELDGKPTDGPPARVLGIHDDGREWWIQVARGDDATNTVVLRLSRFASVKHAGAALRRWNESAASVAPRIIHAMCLL